MPCIEIQHQQSNETLLIPEGQAYAAGWKFTGKIDMACSGHTVDPDEIQKRLNEAGVQWGSAIAWVTKKIGLKQCSGCKAREVILNHANELGWTETIRQLKETL